MHDSVTKPPATRRARWHRLALPVLILGAALRLGAQATSNTEMLDRFAGVGFPSAVGAFSAVRADRYAEPLQPLIARMVETVEAPTRR